MLADAWDSRSSSASSSLSGSAVAAALPAAWAMLVSWGCFAGSSAGVAGRACSLLLSPVLSSALDPVLPLSLQSLLLSGSAAAAALLAASSVLSISSADVSLPQTFEAACSLDVRLGVSEGKYDPSCDGAS